MTVASFLFGHPVLQVAGDCPRDSNAIPVAPPLLFHPIMAHCPQAEIEYGTCHATILVGELDFSTCER